MFNLMGLHAMAKKYYTKCKKEYIKGLEKQGRDFITEKEGKILNYMVRRTIIADTRGNRPVAPKDIVKVYKKVIPSVSLVSAAEKEERFRTHVDAVNALADAIVASNGYHDNLIWPYLKDSEKRVARTFDKAKSARFFECCKRMKPFFYRDEELTEDQLKERINEAEKEKNGHVYEAIRQAVTLFEGISAPEISDDILISLYPKISQASQIIAEARGLLKEMKGKLPQGVTETQGEELTRRITALMPLAAKADNRMMIMSDPYYQDIKLEALWKATPEQISELDKKKAELFKSEGLTVDRGEMCLYEPLDPSVLMRCLVGRYADDANEGKMKDEFPMPELEMRTHERYGKRDKTIDEEENVVDLLHEINRIQRQFYDNKVMSALNITPEDYKDNFIICDENGTVVDAGSASAVDVLKATGGQFYVLSKFGDFDPVPVVIDKTKDKFEILVGKDSINAADTPNIAQRPTIGWFANAVNFVWEGITGSKTNAKKNYLRNKELYEYKLLKKQLGDGNIPNSVLTTNTIFQSKNEIIGNLNSAARVKNVADELVIMKNILDSNEVNVPACDSVLAHLLVNKALSLATNNAMRKNMINVLGALSSNYKEEDAITKLKNSDAFKEFAWKLRKDNFEDIERLKDENDADSALMEMLESFTEVSNGKHFYEKPLSDEYKQVKEEILNKPTLNKIKRLNESTRIELEKHLDNEAEWKNIMSIYGPERPLRLDWVYETSGRRVYTVDDWKKMQESEVNTADFKSNTIRMLGDRTFASLAMIMSQRSEDFITAWNMQNDKSMPVSMPFDGILGEGEGPADHTNMILESIVEPTRKELINLLNHFDDKVLKDENDQERGSAKDVLADHIAEGLLLFRNRANNFHWNGRATSTLAAVANNVRLFALRNGMMDRIMERGVTEDDLEFINISCRMGHIVNEGENALSKLCMDKDKRQLTEEEKRACIDDIMLYRAIQADVESVREKDKPLKYSERAKSVLKDNEAINELSKRMMSEKERDALAKMDPAVIYRKLCKENYVEEAEQWATDLKRTDTYIKENPNHEILEDSKEDEIENSQTIMNNYSRRGSNVITNEEDEKSENNKSFYSSSSSICC